MLHALDRIAALGSDFEGTPVGVGGEDRHVPLEFGLARLFAKNNGQRIGLFPRGAGGGPDPHLVLRLAAGEEAGDHPLFQFAEGNRVAEKLGDLDEEIPVEGVEFLLIGVQNPGVGLQVFELAKLHPALDASGHSRFLVLAEVELKPAPQQAEDFPEPGRLFLAEAGQYLGSLLRRCGLVVQQEFGHPFRGELQVAAAARQSRARHAVELGRLETLHQYQPPGLMNFPDAARAVAAGTGEDDSDAAVGGIPGQGGEIDVDGEVRVAGGVAGGEIQPPIDLGHPGFGGDQVDRVRLQRHFVADPVDRHPGMARQQIVHQALEVRREVLNDHEGQAAVRGHMVEEFLQGGQPSGGGADGYDEARLRRWRWLIRVGSRPGSGGFALLGFHCISLHLPFSGN